MEEYSMDNVNKIDDDISTIISENPFSNKYAMKSSETLNESSTYKNYKNNNYSFNAHYRINSTFQKWCFRYLITFIGQILIVMVISLAVMYSKE